MRLLGRVGLVAYGVVHLLIAYLAIRIALGDGGGEPGKSGALQTIAAQPGGTTLLWTITVGMAALAIWQVAEAVWGHRYVSRRRGVRSSGWPARVRRPWPRCWPSARAGWPPVTRSPGGRPS